MPSRKFSFNYENTFEFPDGSEVYFSLHCAGTFDTWTEFGRGFIDYSMTEFRLLDFCGIPLTPEDLESPFFSSIWAQMKDKVRKDAEDFLAQQIRRGEFDPPSLEPLDEPTDEPSLEGEKP